jgi:hypothetical protein
VTRANGSRTRTCALCGRTVAPADAVVAESVAEPILRLVRQDHPEWPGTGYLCRADLARYRARFVQSLLETEKGELTHLEREVLESLRAHELIATDVEQAFEKERTRGERWADAIAAFGGSWSFLVAFGAFAACWLLNLKAELEIRHLHEKIDHLLSSQWERLVQIQQVQLELLAEISRAQRPSS